MDMNSLVTGLFKGQTFKTLDKIIIGGTFRLRKIFTMRSCPPASEGYQVDDTAHIDIIPKPCQMSPSLSVLTQVNSFVTHVPHSCPLCGIDSNYNVYYN